MQYSMKYITYIMAEQASHIVESMEMLLLYIAHLIPHLTAQSILLLLVI